MRKVIIYGGLSAMALPPLHIFPLLFISLPGLFSEIRRASNRRIAFLVGLTFGFVHHIFGLYWITEAVLLRARLFWWLIPIAVPLLAATLALFIAIPCAMIFNLRSRILTIILFSGLWVFSDLARQFILTGFPWNCWGSDLALPGVLGTYLIQSASLVGIHGLTLLVLFISSLYWLGRRGVTISCSILVILICFGSWRIHTASLPALGVSAVIVQGNVPETEKWGLRQATEVFRKYLSLTKKGLESEGSGHRVVVWPETASPFLLAEDNNAREAVSDVTGAGVPALIGSVRISQNIPFNSMVVLDPPPHVAAVYDKWHLVPFGEYQPRWLPDLQLGINSFGRGTGPRTLRVPGLPPFAPIICYEAIFSGEIVNEKDRPKWLVNITNDAWFGNSAGPRQHLEAARLRAVEEGLPLVRAANTGISAAYDALGRIIVRLGMDRSGILFAKLSGPCRRTVYSRWGLRIPFLLALVCVILALLPIIWAAPYEIWGLSHKLRRPFRSRPILDDFWL